MANSVEGEKEVKTIYDVPVDSKVKINWSEIEKSIGRSVPIKDKKEFNEKFGTEMEVVELLRVWSKLASISLGASVGGAIGGLIAKLTNSLTLGFGTFITVLVTVAYIVYNYHLHILKEMPHRKQNVTEQYVFLDEGVWEKYIKSPTINAGRQAATFIMSKLRAIWDYFFGEDFDKVVVRRRRQFVLIVGIVGLIALINTFHAYSVFMERTGKMWFPRRWYNRYLTFPGLLASSPKILAVGGGAYVASQILGPEKKKDG